MLILGNWTVVFFSFAGMGGRHDKTTNRKDCKRLSLAAFLKAPIRLPASQEGNRRKTERRDVTLKWWANGQLWDCSCCSLQEAQTRHQKNIWQRCSICREIHNVWSMVLCFPLNKSHSQMACKILNYCLCLQFQLETVYKQNYFCNSLCSSVECIFLLLNKSLEQH